MEIEEEKSHLLSEEMKWRIVHYKKDGLGDRATARVVGEEYNRPSLSHQEVKKIWQKYQETRSVENFWNENGCPSVMSTFLGKPSNEYFKKISMNSLSKSS